MGAAGASIVAEAAAKEVARLPAPDTETDVLLEEEPRLPPKDQSEELYTLEIEFVVELWLWL